MNRFLIGEYFYKEYEVKIYNVYTKEGKLKQIETNFNLPMPYEVWCRRMDNLTQQDIFNSNYKILS